MNQVQTARTLAERRAAALERCSIRKEVIGSGPDGPAAQPEVEHQLTAGIRRGAAAFRASGSGVGAIALRYSHRREVLARVEG